MDSGSATRSSVDRSSHTVDVRGLSESCFRGIDHIIAQSLIFSGEVAGKILAH